jgi:hypothetical protein
MGSIFVGGAHGDGQRCWLVKSDATMNNCVRFRGREIVIRFAISWLFRLQIEIFWLGIDCERVEVSWE